MNKAVLVKKLSGFRGEASLYRLEPAYEYTKWDTTTGEDVTLTTTHVVVSAADVPFSGVETLVFPANKDGEVTSWGELAGQRHVWNHAAALQEMGYEIA